MENAATRLVNSDGKINKKWKLLFGRFGARTRA
ncbi:MAG: hypothetical protein ACI840_002186, partial [Ulvibacter sp.]